ncbi:hypothetical protein D3C85_748810 [compost metagenome]
MWITRTLVVGSLLIGAALPVQATGDGADKSQVGPISAEAMARMRELRPGEYLAKTREGCNVITDEPHPSRKEAFAAVWARFTWEGVCSEGMALGPGKLISRTENGETVSITEGWQLYGRWIGLSIVTNLFPGASYGSKTEVFYWDGEGYGRNVVRPEPLEARKERPWPSVSYLPRDRSQRMYYSLFGSCGANAQPCVSEWKPPYPPVADASAGRTELYCNGSCGNLWLEKAGPIVTAFDTFAKTHAADVAAVKQALEPLLVQRRREAVEAEAQARRDAAEAEVQAKRKAAQAELVAQAEALRKREEAVRAEQQFRTSLQTMNPGQLFARADELSAQGDSARAREVQRALMSRFPNHPLAATAARQMAGESPSSASANATAGQRSSASGAASVPLSPASKSLCVSEQNRFMEATVRSNAYFKGDPRDVVERIVSRNINAQIESLNLLTAEQLKSFQVGHEQTRQLHLKNLEQAANRTAVGYTVNPELTGAELGLCFIKARQGSSAPATPAVGSVSSSSATSGSAASGRLSGPQCEAMKQTVVTTRVPPNASVTASTETVMFMTKMVLDMIAGGCPTDGVTPAQIEAERKERQEQYTAAESACNAVQSGGRRCVPRVHTASTAVAKPPVPQSAPGGSSNGYDPRTGLCWGRSCIPEYDGSSNTSGGGIRTAR